MTAGTGLSERFPLAPNLHYGFVDAGTEPASRVRAAAAAGFRYGELLWLDDSTVPALAEALRDTGFTIWNLATEPTFVLARQGSHDEFLRSFRRYAEHAVTLGCPHITVPTGVGLPYLKRPVQLDIVAAAVASASEIAAAHDVTILLEAANTRHDHPGVLFSRTEDAAFVVRELNTPNVRLQYDMYHSIVEGEDPSHVLPDVIDITAHVQLGDVPERVEPGAGRLDWTAVFDLLESSGYTGVLGIECYPTRPSAEAFAWIQEAVARRTLTPSAPRSRHL